VADSPETIALPDTPSALKAMKKSVLQAIFTQLGLSTDGTREELIERLKTELFE
jgi:hypothetical protein